MPGRRTHTQHGEGSSAPLGLAVADALDGDFQTFLSRVQSPSLHAMAELWDEARGDRRMPSWADLPVIGSLPYAKMLWGFGYDPVSGDLTGVLAGSKIGKWIDAKFYGQVKDQRANYGLGALEQRLITCAATPLAYRSKGRLFKVDSFVVTGERIALPMAADGQTGDGIFGGSDYTAPPLLGPLELLHENCEWYAI